MSHYYVMKRKYGDKIQRLFTDSDSFISEICTYDL